MVGFPDRNVIFGFLKIGVFWVPCGDGVLLKNVYKDGVINKCYLKIGGVDIEGVKRYITVSRLGFILTAMSLAGTLLRVV